MEAVFSGEEGGEGVVAGDGDGRMVLGEERLMRWREVVRWSMSMWVGKREGGEESAEGRKVAELLV